MRKNLTIFSLLLLFVIAVASCKRKEEAKTLSDRVVGQWKKIQYATDDNNNGLIDPYEIHAQEGNTVNEFIFAKDGTGTENNSNFPTLNLNWQVIGDTLRISKTGHNVTNYNIEAINSYNLTLTTGSAFGLAWYLYEKQQP
jgi:hypothetical protein